MARASGSLPGSEPTATIWPGWTLAPPSAASSASRSTSSARRRASAILALGPLGLGQAVAQVGGLVGAALVGARLVGLLGVAGAARLVLCALGLDGLQLLGRRLVIRHGSILPGGASRPQAVNLLKSCSAAAADGGPAGCEGRARSSPRRRRRRPAPAARWPGRPLRPGCPVRRSTPRGRRAAPGPSAPTCEARVRSGAAGRTRRESTC